MMNVSQTHKEQLRAAIERALHLADTQNDYLVAALLSQALDAIDGAPSG